MIAALASLGTADVSPSNPTISTSWSGADSPISPTSANSASSFEFLLLQQIGVSLPAASAYHEAPATGANPISKTVPANDAHSPSEKPTADENSAAINFFFTPPTLIRDTPPAVSADLHPTLSNGASVTTQTEEAISAPNQASAATKSETTSEPLPPVETESSAAMGPSETDTANVEDVKHHAAPTVVASQTDSKNARHLSTQPSFNLVPQSAMTSVQTVEPTAVRPMSSSIADLQMATSPKSLYSSAMTTSLVIQAPSGSRAGGNSSGTSTQDDSKDDMHRAAAGMEMTSSSTMTSASSLVGPSACSVVAQESTTTISGQLSDAIVARLRDEPAGGPTTVRIRLEQKDIGTVDLHLTVQDGVVSIRISATDQLTQQLIDSQMNDLRQSLTQRGVQCGEMQVSGDSSGQQPKGDWSPRPGAIRVTSALRSLRQPVATATESRMSSALNCVA